MNDVIEFLALIGCIFFIAFIGWLAGTTVGEERVYKEAIKAGVARRVVVDPMQTITRVDWITNSVTK